MEPVYLLAGIALVLAAITDFIWTTLWVDGGAGPVTNRLSNAIWLCMRKMSRDHPKILSLAGPIILTATLLMWILLLWAGWTLVFSGSESAVVNSTDSSSATWMERIYYAGYLIFTLGNGDYVPTNGVWQLVTVIATGTGMMFITLGVTYLLSVLGAVTLKRSFAESVLSLGESAAEIVRESWNGEDFHNVNLLLSSFSTQLSTITSQHSAYPILHYYYAEKRQESVPVAVIMLDETLTILRYGIPQRHRPNSLLVKEMRRTIQSYLETMDTASGSAPAPPPLGLDELQGDGLPTVSNEEFRKALETQSDRRNKLAGLARASGVEAPWEIAIKKSRLK